MPPETRRAALRRRVAEGPIIPPLPLPASAVGLILTYLDIRSLVQTASCNSVLRYQVYEEHQELWSKIDFGSYGYTRITDAQLRSFLLRCHAKERCQVLKLTGCTRIHGWGLEPVRGSCVMREMDLKLEPSHQNGPVEINTNFVLPLLSSMPPMAARESHRPENSGSPGLSLVKFRCQRSASNFYSRFDENVAAWYRQFHESLRVQARALRTCCGYCGDVFADKVSWEDMFWTMSSAYCERCMKFTCGGVGVNGCPLTMECQRCMVQSCQPMGPGSETQCPAHEMIVDCEACGKYECFDCCDYDVCFNDDCCAAYCSDCGDVCTECKKGCDSTVFCPACIGPHEANCPGSQEEEEE